MYILYRNSIGASEVLSKLQHVQQKVHILKWYFTVIHNTVIKQLLVPGPTTPWMIKCKNKKKHLKCASYDAYVSMYRLLPPWTVLSYVSCNSLFYRVMWTIIFTPFWQSLQGNRCWSACCGDMRQIDPSTGHAWARMITCWHWQSDWQLQDRSTQCPMLIYPFLYGLLLCSLSWLNKQTFSITLKLKLHLRIFICYHKKWNYPTFVAWYSPISRLQCRCECIRMYHSIKDLVSLNLHMKTTECL